MQRLNRDELKNIKGGRWRCKKCGYTTWLVALAWNHCWTLGGPDRHGGYNFIF